MRDRLGDGGPAPGRAELFAERTRLRGLRIVEAPEVLRHFTAKFEEL